MENFEKKIIITLERTPKVLDAMLRGVCEEITNKNEGEHTWNTKQVLAHLTYTEKHNWNAKLGLILGNESCRTFEKYPVSRQFEGLTEKTNEVVLDEFIVARQHTLTWLKQICLHQLAVDHLKGCLPQYGDITLRELLSTWVAHDITHIHQISRIIAKNFKEAIVLDLIA